MDLAYAVPHEQAYGPQPHPYLQEPVLFVSNLPAYISDETLATAFVGYGPFRPKIIRDGIQAMVSGAIEFRFLEKAEKALAVLQARSIPTTTPPVLLVLSPFPPANPPTPLPPPAAHPRLVKQLPPGCTDSQLYDLFRPFGALASVRAHTQFGADTGVVEFWNEEDARQAEEAMHCADVEGQNIAVQIYQPRRASGTTADFNAAAPTFVPASPQFGTFSAQYSPSPPRPAPFPVRSPAPFVHGPGQQVQLAPMSGPGSSSHSGLIDPCNLFCKNLDPEIDSNGLFTHFRQFGQIVSARVMRDEAGVSRGFGFVSFQTTDQAAAAMHAMNGAQLGSKSIVVRLHEPKQLRQEKLAQRYAGHNGHPRSSSGATSPAASDAGETLVGGWSSPRTRSSVLGSPNAGYNERPERGRRGSGSYFHAALSGTLNMPMRYDDLSSLTPVVRKEVLTGELMRRVRTLDIVPSNEMDALVESLAAASLSEVLQTIQNPDRLKEQVESWKSKHLKPPSVSPPSKSPAPSATPSQDSLLANPDATASAPEHPSTPISVNADLSTPPRTSSPSGSIPPVVSERDRVYQAICKLERHNQSELTDLVMSLPKRERAMCLFNSEVLRSKLVDAKLVLESDGGEAEEPSIPAEPVTPQTKKTVTRSATLEESAGASPRTPDLSSRGASAAASPMPTTPSTSIASTVTSSSTATVAGATTNWTLKGLAKLSALEIVRIASDPNTVLPPGVVKADPIVKQTTDEFVDSLLDKPAPQQKQLLGEKLFKVVKSFVAKGAPKITITLLDQEELRPLAHLMNSYPAVLKDKVLALQLTK
ncbi:Polyadenylate-binding protein, cytoplasmic and nuclear [Leucoagaricus sp. SymC.cos]|nr:Polyadenylate-binding protein, cytoplasmic and nuclear [Leucoagaricus sp. SymC.cos]